MAELPFSLDLVRFLADHRSPALTAFFQLATFLGEIQGYVFLVAVVYVAFDKSLGFRLAVVALAAMVVNHVLKTWIANPRPFVAEGSWAAYWAVSPARAADLVTEYSTPSGHAMAGAAFYLTLAAGTRSRPLRAACLALALATGLSRPYLGVHYLEDVLLGWALGAAVALLALRFGPALGAAWDRLPYVRQAALAVGASALLCVATRWLSEGAGLAAADSLAGPTEPTAFVSYAGLLTGLVLARPVESARVHFDPRRGTIARKALRVVVAVSIVAGTLVLLDVAFAALAADATPLGDLLRYLRYAAAGIAALLLAPLLFTRLQI